MTNELSALVELAGDAVDRLAITPAESLHRAIARRTFKAVGPLSAPVRLLHDGISSLVYGSVRAAAIGATVALAAAVRVAGAGSEVRPVSATRRGRQLVGAINSLLGDELADRDSDLAIRMSVRQAGADVAPTRPGLAAAFPASTGRLAIFLHGLAETEEWWLRGEPANPWFGDRLSRDLGITPLAIRYNTGLHVSENGTLLAQLLEELIQAWPVAVDRVEIVGHSMGGLVARSACHAGQATGKEWVSRLRHLVTLGTPHTGAPLEKAVHAISWTLRRVPESRPIAAILDTRSAGIRDLRFGYLLEEEWSSEDPDRLLHNRRGEVPLLAGCRHTFISASVTRDPAHPLGWMLGDLLVRTESAGGRHRSRSIQIPAEAVVQLGPLTHFDLLDHPLVYERLREALL